MMVEFASGSKYNELVVLVDTEVLNADSKLADKSSIRDILTQLSHIKPNCFLV